VPFVYRSIGDPEHWVAESRHPRLTGLEYRRAATVVALWPGAAEAIQRLHGIPAERLAVIPNARRASDFLPVTQSQRHASRRALGIGPEPVALFVGSLSPEKRVDRAIEAVALTPSHRLLIAGDGGDRSRAQDLSQSLAPGRVTFLGHVADVRRVLAASDVLLISSETEGMPGSAIEALLTGIPVVAPPVGALPEMAGVTLASPTPRALAHALARVPRPPTPRERALRYTWQRVLPQWLDVLSRVVGVEVRTQPAADHE
jgi:glycosyltransferase involved in cell wall biosynthesis